MRHLILIVVLGLGFQVVPLVRIMAQTQASADSQSLSNSDQDAASEHSPREAMVSIKGIMHDKEEGTRMENVRIFFTKKEKRTMVGMITNGKGEFFRKIAPGVYDIEAQYTGKAALRLEGYNLEAGGSYFIEINMGNVESKVTVERRK